MGEPVRVCPSAGSMLGSQRPDGVIVAGPPETHLEHASLAAAAAVPALVEKPPATDAAEAAMLAALDPAPWVGFNRRFAAAGELLAALPPEATDLELELSYLRVRWRPHVVHTDAVDDLGCHLVDLALGALGDDAPKVRALRLSERRLVAELRDRERRVTIRCATDRPWRERVLVRDAAGSVLASTSLGGPLAAVRSRLAGPRDPLGSSLVAQLEAFAATIHGREGGQLATAEQGLAVMRALAAIRASARLGGEWTELGEPLPARSEAAA